MREANSRIDYELTWRKPLTTFVLHKEKLITILLRKELRKILIIFKLNNIYNFLVNVQNKRLLRDVRKSMFIQYYYWL